MSIYDPNFVDSLNDLCCIRGQGRDSKGLRFYYTCLDGSWFDDPPDWNVKKMLDLKMFSGVFQNNEVVEYVRKFLSNAQPIKLLHIEFGAWANDYEYEEFNPVFYETEEWKDFVNFMNCGDFRGEIILDVVMKFTVGSGIEKSVLVSKKFIHACVNAIKKIDFQNVTPLGVADVLYTHSLDIMPIPSDETVLFHEIGVDYYARIESIQKLGKLENISWTLSANDDVTRFDNLTLRDWHLRQEQDKIGKHI